MGYTKVSVTIPREIYEEIKEFSASHAIKLSHVVTEALSDKLRQLREEALIREINRIYEDPEVSQEQQKMAETIAESVDVEELPW